MKKTYGKPDIVFDNFRMCSSIAWCAEPVNMYRGTCGKRLNGYIMVFASAASDVEESACNYDVDVMDGIDIVNEDYNGLCYHVPTEDGSMFHS